jgi:hypothetical protein
MIQWIVYINPGYPDRYVRTDYLPSESSSRVPAEELAGKSWSKARHILEQKYDRVSGSRDGGDVGMGVLYGYNDSLKEARYEGPTQSS